MCKDPKNSNDYKSSGVDINEGNRFVSLIKDSVSKSNINGVIGGIGGFAGLFSLGEFKSMVEPVLVSGTDGVGTKLKIAIDSKIYDTVGIDLVAMCVNDIMVIGAKPLFFLDYIGVGKLVPESMKSIVDGITAGCIESEMALLGGETAEMPGMYKGDDFDLAGFAVGIVDREKMIDGTKINIGDRLIGIASSGFHSNGFSLIRKVLLDNLKLPLDTKDFVDGKTLAEALLIPTKLYVKLVGSLLSSNVKINGMVHITGGGFYENIPRVLADNLSVKIDPSKIVLPDVYKKFLSITDIASRELYTVFNMGVGYIIITDEKSSKDVIEQARSLGYTASDIGEVIAGDKQVHIEGID